MYLPIVITIQAPRSRLMYAMQSKKLKKYFDVPKDF